MFYPNCTRNHLLINNNKLSWISTCKQSRGIRLIRSQFKRNQAKHFDNETFLYKWKSSLTRMHQYFRSTVKNIVNHTEKLDTMKNVFRILITIRIIKPG
jgi:hypothetical protein